MRVELGNHGVTFNFRGHSVRVVFGWYTRYVFIDGKCFDDITGLAEDIINRRDVEAVERLKKLAEKFRDTKTREKYAEYWANGCLKTSRELTAELRARAAVKNRRALGFRVDLSKFNPKLGEGWVFAGPWYRGHWEAYVIPDCMELIGYIEGSDVEVKNAVLGLIEGRVEAAEKFHVIPLSLEDACCHVRKMIERAEEWNLREFIEIAGVVEMARQIMTVQSQQ